ncbi:MAG: HPF/RaiA family ribosome-associated protein [Chitinophagaceae bacterium]|nr:MAG: HPF/RaiA family ribosome-associated protein [Chitinophagaceae bacterium]
MDVIIQSLGFKHSNELEGYINDKLNKLKPNDRIIRANVTLFQGPDRATPEDYCEIRLEVPGPDLFVKESAATFEQSVDACVDTLAVQLRKAHEKQIDRKQRSNPNDILTDQLLADTDDEEKASYS